MQKGDQVLEQLEQELQHNNELLQERIEHVEFRLKIKGFECGIAGIDEKLRAVPVSMLDFTRVSPGQLSRD